MFGMISRRAAIMGYLRRQLGDMALDNAVYVHWLLGLVFGFGLGGSGKLVRILPFFWSFCISVSLY